MVRACFINLLILSKMNEGYIIVSKEELSGLLEKAQRLASTPPKKWVRRREAAALAGVAVRTIDKRTAAGLYTISKAPGRTSTLYILRSDIEAELDRNRRVKVPRRK
jgi:hypothetical protein